MISWGLILWLIGLSVITFFGVMWLLDISNRQRELQEKLEHTYIDGEGRDVSEPILALTQRVEESESRVQELHAAVQQSRTELGEFASQLPSSVQAVGLVRFQAFSDYGGDQSFALALADASGDGVVITGIYAREGTRVYAKPLSKWTSQYSLSFEEENAIKQARGLPQQKTQ
jgi:hypothetical protein